MPVTRRRAAQGNAAVVDITDSPGSTSSRQPRTRKRSRDQTGDSGAATKRKKQTKVDTVDLDEGEDEAPSADAEMLKVQQLEALKAQQGRDDGPVKIGKRTCIICLENYTNATTASCGEFVFHGESPKPLANHSPQVTSSATNA